MERIISEDTKTNFKDNFNKQRQNIISQFKTFDSQMNKTNNFKTNNQFNQNLQSSGNTFFNKKYSHIMTDSGKNQLNSTFKPIPITNVDKTYIKNIKPLHHSSDYGNFIPLPKNSQDIKIERDFTPLETALQTDFANDIKKKTHPKTMYMIEPDMNTELLKNQKTIVPETKVNINSVYSANESHNNSWNNLNSQIYIAEIGDKRKLAVTIFNNLINSYEAIKNSNIEIDVIEEIMNNMNIYENHKWKKNDTKEFVARLNRFIENTESNIKLSKFNPSNHLFERETKEIDYFITIDSKDRYRKNWPNPNHYQIIFDPINQPLNENTGYISKSFNNVKSVELIEAIIPKNNINGTDFNKLPYIFLDVDELGTNYQGTNNNISKSFAQLIFNKTIGEFRYCKFKDQNRIKKLFNPRIALTKLTIKFVQPNGELYNFGESCFKENCIQENIQNNDQETDPTNQFIDEGGNFKFSDETENNNKKIIKECVYEPNNILTFKITCIQKALETMFLNNKN